MSLSSSMSRTLKGTIDMASVLRHDMLIYCHYCRVLHWTSVSILVLCRVGTVLLRMLQFAFRCAVGPWGSPNTGSYRTAIAVKCMMQSDRFQSLHTDIDGFIILHQTSTAFTRHGGGHGSRVVLFQTLWLRFSWPMDHGCPTAWHWHHHSATCLPSSIVHSHFCQSLWIPYNIPTESGSTFRSPLSSHLRLVQLVQYMHQKFNWSRVHLLWTLAYQQCVPSAVTCKPWCRAVVHNHWDSTDLWRSILILIKHKYHSNSNKLCCERHTTKFPWY